MPAQRSFDFQTNTLTLTPDDIEAITRLSWAEAGIIAAQNPAQAPQAFSMVMDSVMNRVAAKAYEVYGTTPTQLSSSQLSTAVQAVIDQPGQYEPISKTKNKSWTGLPQAPPEVTQYGQQYIGSLMAGMPQTGFAPLEAQPAKYLGFSPEQVTPLDTFAGLEMANPPGWKATPIDYAAPPQMETPEFLSGEVVDPGLMGTHFANMNIASPDWKAAIEPGAVTLGTGMQQHLGGTLHGKGRAPDPRPLGPYSVALSDPLSLQYATPEMFGVVPEMADLGVPAPQYAGVPEFGLSGLQQVAELAGQVPSYGYPEQEVQYAEAPPSAPPEITSLMSRGLPMAMPQEEASMYAAPTQAQMTSAFDALRQGLPARQEALLTDDVVAGLRQSILGPAAQMETAYDALRQGLPVQAQPTEEEMQAAYQSLRSAFPAPQERSFPAVPPGVNVEMVNTIPTENVYFDRMAVNQFAQPPAAPRFLGEEFSPTPGPLLASPYQEFAPEAPAPRFLGEEFSPTPGPYAVGPYQELAPEAPQPSLASQIASQMAASAPAFQAEQESIRQAAEAARAMADLETGVGHPPGGLTGFSPSPAMSGFAPEPRDWSAAPGYSPMPSFAETQQYTPPGLEYSSMPSFAAAQQYSPMSVDNFAAMSPADRMALLDIEPLNTAPPAAVAPVTLTTPEPATMVAPEPATVVAPETAPLTGPEHLTQAQSLLGAPQPVTPTLAPDAVPATGFGAPTPAATMQMSLSTTTPGMPALRDIQTPTAPAVTPEQQMEAARAAIAAVAAAQAPAAPAPAPEAPQPVALAAPAPEQAPAPAPAPAAAPAPAIAAPAAPAGPTPEQIALAATEEMSVTPQQVTQIATLGSVPTVAAPAPVAAVAPAPAAPAAPVAGAFATPGLGAAVGVQPGPLAVSPVESVPQAPPAAPAATPTVPGIALATPQPNVVAPVTIGAQPPAAPPAAPPAVKTAPVAPTVGVTPPAHLTQPAPQPPLSPAETGIPTAAAPSPQFGGYEVGQALFGGGPEAINFAGDTAPKSYGPDYGGPMGINTSFTGPRTTPPSVSMSPTPTAAAPSPSAGIFGGSFGFDSMFGGMSQDTLGLGGAPSLGGGGLNLGGGGLNLGGPTGPTLGGPDTPGGDFSGTDFAGSGSLGDTLGGLAESLGLGGDTDYSGGSVGSDTDYSGTDADGYSDTDDHDVDGW